MLNVITRRPAFVSSAALRHEAHAGATIIEPMADLREICMFASEKTFQIKVPAAARPSAVSILLGQFAEGAEVDEVPGFAFVIAFGSFEVHGNAAEAAVAEEVLEAGGADLAAAD